ncbi:MAG: hypothetical protein CL398_08465 [Acidiferrobacteraceae bacterium]|nr:hypothetical protein [Acidiferrobacteraceae bacterium]|tara:strand:- start:66 stop:443 length:378 start_codon:yes stop_codon:yes gene_type:complete
MNIKVLFWIQGALLIILGGWGMLDGDSALSSFGWESTRETLTLNRGFSLSQLVLGVIAVRIPTWVGNNLKEPALIGGAINTAFLVNILYDLNSDFISGSGAIINLILTIIFAILFFVMGARHKSS